MAISKNPQFPHVDGKYGAPMGRREYNDGDYSAKVRLFRVKLDSGGYDQGGAYWGTPSNLYCATDGAGFRVFVRAESREAAKAKVVADNAPGLTFYR